MGINNKRGNWWQSGKILFFFHTRRQQEEGKEKRGTPKEGEILYSVFCFYREER